MKWSPEKHGSGSKLKISLFLCCQFVEFKQRGFPNPQSRMRCGKSLDLMLCCHHLKILNYFIFKLGFYSEVRETMACACEQESVQVCILHPLLPGIHHLQCPVDTELWWIHEVQRSSKRVPGKCVISWLSNGRRLIVLRGCTLCFSYNLLHQMQKALASKKQPWHPICPILS